jgi:hypothetical protein
MATLTTTRRPGGRCRRKPHTSRLLLEPMVASVQKSHSSVVGWLLLLLLIHSLFVII